jgi:hypothetical protein
MATYETKAEIEHVADQHRDTVDLDDVHKPRDEAPRVQRQAVDLMSVRQAAWAYRKVGFFCLLAAFSASLDGYQGEFTPPTTKIQTDTQVH